ncbi:hypothetical protein EV1_033786 [Malus domestica]
MSQAGYQFGEGATSPRETRMYRELRDVPTDIPWKLVRRFQGKSHALDQTFLLPREDGDLRKKAPVVHDSTQDPLVLQLLKEVNKLKAERQVEIPDWNQPRPDPLTKRILDTPSKERQSRSLACNSILERRTRLNTLTSLSPPWHTGCTPTKSDVFSSLPPSLAEL